MPTDRRVNVLMVSVALPSHIKLVLKVAKRLISKGVHVTIATTEEARHRILKNPNSQSSSDICFEFFSDGLSLDFDRSNTEAVINSLQTKGSENLSSLIATLTEVQDYSCVIVTPILHWAIDIAAEHGIPCALLWVQASAVYSICYRYFKNIDVFPNLGDLNEKVHLPGLPTFEVRDLPSFMLPSSPNHLRQILVSTYQSLDKAKWVLGTCFYEAEEEIVKSMASLTPIYPIGPFVSPFLLGEKETNAVSVDLWDAEDSCIEWLDNKPSSSVIYVSFGSLVVLSKKHIDNLATALKNSNKAFLWVLNPTDKGSNKEDGVELSHEFLEETKGRGLVVKWCQQERVLMHPAVACFVSHCGFNSMIETLITGVPVVACPYFSDHPTNAMLITNVFRIGLRARCGEDCVASAEEIERCIWEVMDGPNAREIKKRALEMKELVREALHEGGTSDKNINQFISYITAGNPQRD